MRLNLSPGEARYTLFPQDGDDPGIYIMALPALSEVVENAKADPSMQALGDEMRALLETVEGEEADAAQAAEVFKSRSKVGLMMAKSIARSVITGWGGVEDPDGSPAPVTPERVDAFLDLAPVYDKFTEVYLSRWLTLQAEKNDFAPSPTGTSGTAQNTAVPARRSVKPARAG